MHILATGCSPDQVPNDEMRLALSSTPAYAGSSPRYLGVHADPGMATTIKNWKKFVAGKYGVDWQRDFFDHHLRVSHQVEEKASYLSSGSQRIV